jgi:hypothetical protein
MEEQTKVSLQESASAFMETNAAQDHDILNAILGQPTPNDVLEILGPGLAADKESFARDVIKALLPYDVKLDAARRQATE